MDATNVVIEGEVWKDIPGYEQTYQISNLGNVRSKDRYENVNGGTRFRRAKILRPTLNHHGYFHVSLYESGKGKTLNVHQLVAWAFLGEQASLMQVNHIDGNKTNNRPSNLEYVTQSGNTKHACDMGLIVNSRRHKRCKLSDEQVLQFRDLFKKGNSPYSIAKRFNYDPSCAARICKGTMYAWVK